MIDGVIAEPEGGAHHDHAATALSLREELIKQLDDLTKKSSDELRDERYQKFRHFGVWQGEELA